MTDPDPSARPSALESSARIGTPPGSEDAGVVDGDGPGEAQPTDGPDASADGSIEELATTWLETERQAIALGNANDTEDRARLASAAYEAAVGAATSEELLLAWHAAEAAAGRAEMGSKAWADAREVAKLLRVEYLAARN